MADFNQFNIFVEDLAHGEHDLGSDQLKLAFCSAANAPAATDAVLADLTVIDSSDIDSVDLAVSSSGQAGGVYVLKITDKVLTAGAEIPAFKFIVLYNSQAATKTNPLIGWYAYPTDQVLYTGDKFNINFDEDNGVITLGPPA